MNSSVDATEPQGFAQEVPAVPEQLPLLRDALESWLSRAGCSRERIERLLLAASEAVTNSIEHAYPDGPGPVRLTADMYDDRTIRMTVTDHGRWRPVDPQPTPRGRGVFMMQECGDDVRIRSSEAGTTVEIFSGLAGHPDSAAYAKQTLDGFSVERHTAQHHVVTRVSGGVPAAAADDLCRRLLAACYGGIAPLTVDVSAVGPETGGLEPAIAAVAGAAAGVGGEVSVVVPRNSRAASSVAWDRLAAAVSVTELP